MSHMSDLRQDQEVSFPHGPRFTTRAIRQLKIKDWLISHIGNEGDDWILHRLSRTATGGFTQDMVCCKLEAGNLMCHIAFIDEVLPIRKPKKL